jgi:hypothetical protein
MPRRLSRFYYRIAQPSRLGGPNTAGISHDDFVIREFCNAQVCPVAVRGASVSLAYRRRTLAVDGNVVRSFGHELIQRVTAGWRIDRRRSLVLSNFPTDPNDPNLASDFLTTWAPLSEIRSEPYLRYETNGGAEPSAFAATPATCSSA